MEEGYFSKPALLCFLIPVVKLARLPGFPGGIINVISYNDPMFGIAIGLTHGSTCIIDAGKFSTFTLLPAKNIIFAFGVHFLDNMLF